MDYDHRHGAPHDSVTHPNQVLAVIFETTGDVSVIQQSDEVDPWIFEEVRGAERLGAIDRSDDLEHA